MKTIADITKEYRQKIDYLDLELIISHSLGKTREFVLAHPEYKIPISRNPKLKTLFKRRIKHEPLAYILGRKEFYGLDFAVNKNTLVPRPETELLVEQAIQETRNKKQETNIIDVGTGSGNIIISIAKNTKAKNEFFATDISPKALTVAKSNAKKHRVDGKIKFLRGNLLSPLLKAKKLTPDKLIIVANLPYLSKKIYQSTPTDVKKYEPKSALYSAKRGLDHYEKLLKQIKKISVMCSMLQVSCFIEISPEQKQPLAKIINKTLPDAKTEFTKDLAGKWRICKVTL